MYLYCKFELELLYYKSIIHQIFAISKEEEIRHSTRIG